MKDDPLSKIADLALQFIVDVRQVLREAGYTENHPIFDIPCSKKCAAKKIKDERANHTAIKLSRSLMSRFPDKLWWDDIIQIFGEHPDSDKAILCRKTWIGRGYNNNSLDWIYWYRDGIPERNGNGNRQKPTVERDFSHYRPQ